MQPNGMDLRKLAEQRSVVLFRPRIKEDGNPEWGAQIVNVSSYHQNKSEFPQTI